MFALCCSGENKWPHLAHLCECLFRLAASTFPFAHSGVGALLSQFTKFHLPSVVVGLNRLNIVTCDLVEHCDLEGEEAYPAEETNNVRRVKQH
jgi:hypothetical protein